MQYAIPDSDDALLDRAQTAAALSRIGFPVSKATLATKATRGGGPPFRCFGRRPLYRWREAREWAAGMMGPVATNTAGAGSARKVA